MMALHDTLVCDPETFALTKLGLFFPVVCFIPVSDLTLAEKLYRDKGLYRQVRSRDENKFCALRAFALRQSKIDRHIDLYFR